ncbi:hypothetical protein QVD17_20522 [Tagetes erecta]|uniref:Uncharacterized protein n=1 Tax=Tagetes erecta TaxID=13708 RepID=A0AAD8NY88_TARER|nr:hypothetical protein QVD17_20522 [Tagetes erecta]
MAHHFITQVSSFLPHFHHHFTPTQSHTLINNTPPPPQLTHTTPSPLIHPPLSLMADTPLNLQFGKVC